MAAGPDDVLKDASKLGRLPPRFAHASALVVAGAPVPRTRVRPLARADPAPGRAGPRRHELHRRHAMACGDERLRTDPLPAPPRHSRSAHRAPITSAARRGSRRLHLVTALEAEVFSEDPWTLLMIAEELSSPASAATGSRRDGLAIIGYGGAKVGGDRRRHDDWRALTRGARRDRHP